VMDALRKFNIPPGDYMTPKPGSPADMRSPAYQEKLTRGPVMITTGSAASRTTPNTEVSHGPRSGLRKRGSGGRWRSTARTTGSHGAPHGVVGSRCPGSVRVTTRRYGRRGCRSLTVR